MTADVTTSADPARLDRPSWTRSRRLIGWILLATWLTLLGAGWSQGVRTATLADLESRVASGGRRGRARDRPPALARDTMGLGWLIVLVAPVGATAYLLLGGPSGVARPSAPDRRLTGGWALLLALVLGSLLKPGP